MHNIILNFHLYYQEYSKLEPNYEEHAWDQVTSKDGVEETTCSSAFFEISKIS